VTNEQDNYFNIYFLLLGGVKHHKPTNQPIKNTLRILKRFRIIATKTLPIYLRHDIRRIRSSIW